MKLGKYSVSGDKSYFGSLQTSECSDTMMAHLHLALFQGMASDGNSH